MDKPEEKTRAEWEAEFQALAERLVERTGGEAAVVLVLEPPWAPGVSAGGIAGSARCSEAVARHYFYDAARKMLELGSFRCSYPDCAVCRARDGQASN